MTWIINTRNKPRVATVLECEVILRSRIKEQRLRLIDFHLNDVSGSADLIPATVNVKYDDVRVLWNSRLPVI